VADEGGRVLVGRIVRPHGVRGELVVEVLSDNPERLAAGSELLVTGDEPDAAPAVRSGGGDPGPWGSARYPAGSPPPPEGGSPPAVLRVATSRPHRGRVLVEFEGVGDREAAERLRGLGLAVERAAVPPAPSGTWYHFQLLGCRCRDAAAGDLGEVVELVEDGGGLLLVVDDGRRRLPVPFVGEFVRRVDLGAGVIEVELPPGLIETCASTS
jgi:16S rRNA processing protein RimM